MGVINIKNAVLKKISCFIKEKSFKQNTSTYNILYVYHFVFAFAVCLSSFLCPAFISQLLAISDKTL